MPFRPCSVRWLCAALLLAAAATVAAHPGGLNAEGCHNNRKTGDYHCHRGAPARTSSSAREGAAAVPAGRAFRNCAEARAAGAAPVRAGEPGYGPHLDRDGDGVGCEPYRRR
ncbi:excalibur calcium-binding domain-containing protein [Methyloversatilis sp.]|uniref:excalibur calcium-binding domain-containing protein n=1 Tax=Methyloversatilis sp. TaxID=2569862 RepID=UPI003D2DB77E